MSVLVGVGPQVYKFEQVSSDDRQRGVRSLGLMSRGGGGNPLPSLMSTGEEEGGIPWSDIQKPFMPVFDRATISI